MTEPTDMDALARRYMDLWQEQMARASADPSLMEGWRAVLEATAKTLGLDPTAQRPPESKDASSSGFTTAGSETATSAPGDGRTDLADVLRRLDAMERRLAILEADRKGD